MPNEERIKQIRDQAEGYAKEDLSKKLQHLLADVHDELLQEEREGSDPHNLHIENLVHAQKRIASIFVKTAIENGELTQKNIELQKSIGRLTKSLKTYTIILLIIGLISIIPIFINFFKWLLSMICNC